MMDDTNAEIADLWNRIEHLQERVESTRTNLTVTIIALMIHFVATASILARVAL